MEAPDAFTQSQQDDPFAGSEFGDFEQPAEATDVPIDTSGLPVVDKEGNRVDDPFAQGDDERVAPADGDTPAHVPADGASVESQEGEKPLEQVDPNQPGEGGLPTLTPEQQAEAARKYREERGEPVEQPDKDVPITHQMAGADTSALPAQEKVEAALEPTPPAESAGPTDLPPVTPDPESEAELAAAQADAAAGVDEAPLPVERKGKDGKATHRRYVILRVDGPDKFTQINWYEDGKGNLTERASGAKRQKVLLARGTEEALKFGYAAIGAPTDGATLIAVAAAYFQPKKIKPMPPEPMRQRLQIS